MITINNNMNLALLANSVLKHLDIVEVAENEGLKLKKKGRNFFTLCPFHSERTSSFSINPNKQMFYCFGCNKGGNAIHLIAALRGTSKGKVIYEAAMNLGLITGSGLNSMQRKEMKQRVIDYEFAKSEISNFEKVFNFLCDMVHAFRKSMKHAQNWRDAKLLQHFYQIYDKLPYYEYLLDCMLGSHGSIAQVEAYLTGEEVMKKWNFRTNK